MKLVETITGKIFYNCRKILGRSPAAETTFHQNSSEVLPSVSSTKNGALAFLSIIHSPKAVDDAVDDEAMDDEVSPRHKEETLTNSSKLTPPPWWSGLWTKGESLRMLMSVIN